jgi:hypothetical protein
MNGVHKDPQTVHLPGAEPLHAQALQTFRSQTAPLVADLAPAAAPAAAAVPTLVAAPLPTAPPAVARSPAANGRLAGRAPIASTTSVN